MNNETLKKLQKDWGGILDSLIVLVWIWIIIADSVIHWSVWWGWSGWWIFTWWTIFWLILIEFVYTLWGKWKSGESGIWHAYGWVLLNQFIIFPGIVLVIYEPNTWIAWISMITVGISSFTVFFNSIWCSEYNIWSRLKTLWIWVIFIISANYTATVETETFIQSLPRWIIISLICLMWLESYLQSYIKKLRFRHDHILLFESFGVATQLYDVRNATIFHTHLYKDWEFARKKTKEDEKVTYPWSNFSLDRFPKVDFKWESLDGETHEYTVDLNILFKDRRVPHTEDPKLIYTPKPITGGEPTIILEINNRTINIYMFVTIQIISADPNIKKRTSHDHRTLVFTKTF